MTFTGILEIDASKVQGAPTIGTVLEVLEPMLKGRPIYQHSGFNRSAVRAACVALGRDEPARTGKIVLVLGAGLGLS